MTKVSFRIEAIQSACTYQTVQQSTTLATVIAPEEDAVLLTKTDGS